MSPDPSPPRQERTKPQELKGSVMQPKPWVALSSDLHGLEQLCEIPTFCFPISTVGCLLMTHWDNALNTGSESREVLVFLR